MKHQDLRIALYARVSTEAQEDEGQSLSTQVAMMTEAVARLGATVAEVYQIQESAMPDKERPSLTSMLKDASLGRFDAVMVCKMDRLSRSIAVWNHVENSLRQFGILLFEGQDEHNLRSAEGRLNRGMQALIGEYSVNRLKWSAAASRLERARRGWPHSGMVPFGRMLKDVKGRKDADAEWIFDEPKAKLAAEMYSLYVGQGLSLGQVGARVSMNPETVRRVMMDQGGPEWVRSFLDPATGVQVEVRTAIPRLFSDAQLLKLQERAKQNQLERAGWAGRKRDYPLSLYLRCSNPECNWSNLSGRTSSFFKLTAASGRPSAEKDYSYYMHLPRNRHGADCLKSVPAGQLEDEIFSRLGQLLSDSGQLVDAVRAAMITAPEEIQKLKVELAELVSAKKSAGKLLSNALEVVFEMKGTAAGAMAQAKVDEQNKAVAQIEERLAEVRQSLKVVDFPKDFPERFANTMHRMVGLNGHMPMHWPTKAKKALLALFFGGTRSTRFDRKGRHQHSDQRGIFVTKVETEWGAPYWRYEARGSIGDFSGALTSIVSVYDKESSEPTPRRFTPEEVMELSALATTFEGLLPCRSSPQASTPAR